MALIEPTNVSDCLYFTNRTIGTGKIKAWVFKGICSCNGKMVAVKPASALAKPKEYVCESCGKKVSTKEYEEALPINVKYTCPKCGNLSELQVPYKRKKIKIFDEEDQKERTADAVQFECGKCKEKLNITKKLK